MHAFVVRLIPDRRWRWALGAGGAAALRAGVILLALRIAGPASPLLAAASAFLIATPLSWSVLTPTRGRLWRLTAASAGLLCAVLPHPLFWLAHDMAYGPISFFGELNVVSETRLSLMFVGPFTAIASIISTTAMATRYTAGSAPPASDDLAPDAPADGGSRASRRQRIRSLLRSALLISLAAAVAGGLLWSLRPLLRPGGQQIQRAPLEEADLNAINATGQIVGAMNRGGYAAFVWQDGRAQLLGTLGGDESQAFDINDAGQIVGSASAAGDATHAFLYEDGVMTDLGIPGRSSSASQINERGQILGSYAVAVGGARQHRAYLWSSGVFTDIGMLGPTANAIWPADLNNAGQIVGSGRTAGDEGGQPFLWEQGRLTPLADAGDAHDINDRGQVVGSVRQPSGAVRAALWERGQLTVLDVPGGGRSEARAINERGQIAGWVELSRNQRRAVLWQDGRVIELGIAPVAEVTIVGLSEQGQVLINAFDQTERAMHSYLWQSGALTDLGKDLTATGLSERGQVIGSQRWYRSDLPYSSSRPFLWDGVALRTLEETEPAEPRSTVVALPTADIGSLVTAAAVTAVPAQPTATRPPAPVQTSATRVASAATGINSRGQVIGHYGDPDRAYLWQDGKATDLGTLGGPSAWPAAISDGGDVVGWSTTKDEQTHAALWRDGAATDLGTLGGQTSKAYGVNERGQVVGVAETAGGETHAVLWQDGKISDLGTLGGPASEARAINERGQIAGVAETDGGETHAALWHDGKVTDLGALGAQLNVTVAAISDAGQIAGTIDYTSAYLWDDGAVTRLGALGGAMSEATGMNAEGQIIGHAFTASNEYHAFLWQGGAMTDLGTLGSTNSFAWGMNDLGVVVGGSLTGDQIQHSYRWQAGQLTDLGVEP